MKQLLVLLLFAFSIQLHAQVGISASYVQQDVEDWQLVATEEYGNEVENKFLKSGFEVGVDYWFRLKKYRIEFFPTISYSTFSNKLNNPYIEFSPIEVPSIEGKYLQNNYAFHLKTNIYPLDFEGDCDCPTWKKDGNVIKKGWFVQLIGGVKSVNNSYELNDFSKSQSGIVYDAGIGTGLDIGVSEFLTVTPYVNYLLSFGAEWEGLHQLAGDSVEAPTLDNIDFHPTDMNRLAFGIRLGFRFDELNKYGFR